MKSLCFIVPVHGRLNLTRVCLRQLRRTCIALQQEGVHASAIVISDEASLADLGDDLCGFGTVRRDNKFLSRRFNDGIQLATDPMFNPAPADFVVPFGSDDWADHRLFLEPLPDPDTIQGFQWVSFVSEDGDKISATYLNYDGGSGIRIIPRQLVAPLGYRPADEDRPRYCDMSILRNLRAHHGDALKIKHMHLHDRQIVDWKTPTEQLNSYRQITALRRSSTTTDPFTVLADHYPSEALTEMERHYFGAKVPA